MNRNLASPVGFTAEDFATRAAMLGEMDRDDVHVGDHRLNPELADKIVRDGLRPAAVLIGVVDHQHGASVVLTQRTATLRTHSGQIAFPGGRIDKTDVSPEHAALRETHEEIGLGSGYITIVGRLPNYITGSGFTIAPVLATVKPEFQLRINPDEVDDVFEVPLSFLMDPRNHHRESRVWEGKERFYITMPYERRKIWGITAGIIHTLYERLYV